MNKKKSLFWSKIFSHLNSSVLVQVYNIVDYFKHKGIIIMSRDQLNMLVKTLASLSLHNLSNFGLMSSGPAALFT